MISDIEDRLGRSTHPGTAKEDALAETRHGVRRSQRLILTLILLFLLMPCQGLAAEVRGKITLPDGRSPAANEPITMDNREIGRTDGAGIYVLDLPPGNKTFVLRGQRYPVWVSPHGNRQDIQLH
jgi:hypothetical protein